VGIFYVLFLQCTGILDRERGRGKSECKCLTTREGDKGNYGERERSKSLEKYICACNDLGYTIDVRPCLCPCCNRVVRHARNKSMSRYTRDLTLPKPRKDAGSFGRTTEKERS
jgi:hypothetical protein